MYFTILDLRIMFFNMFYRLHVFVRNGTPYKSYSANQISRLIDCDTIFGISRHHVVVKKLTLWPKVSRPPDVFLAVGRYPWTNALDVPSDGRTLCMLQQNFFG